jgi:hypothetical protein
MYRHTQGRVGGWFSLILVTLARTGAARQHTQRQRYGRFTLEGN